ncbi:MAG: Calx-beta domain-containing protein [Lysobacteraceae bacterium]
MRLLHSCDLAAVTWLLALIASAMSCPTNAGDELPALSLSFPQCPEGNSGDNNCPLRLSLSHSSKEAVSGRLSLDVPPGMLSPATPGQDFAALSDLAWSIPPDQTQLDIPVTVRGDLRHEPDESLRARVTELTGARFATHDFAYITLLNDDQPPPLNISHVLCAEGDSGITPCEIKLALQGESEAGFGGNYTFYGDGQQPATVGVDIQRIEDVPGEIDPRRHKATLRNGSWRIEPGANGTTIPLGIIGDSEREGAETLRLALFTQYAGIGRRSQTCAMLTIMDDDGDEPGLWAGDASVLEPDSGEQATLRFEVVLSPAASNEVRVAWATAANAEASVNVDFEFDSGVLVFAAGETRKHVDVTVLGDDTVEIDERFALRLGLPVGATIQRQLGIGTIRNDEPSPGRLRLLHSASIRADESIDEVPVLIERIDGDSGEASVSYATVDGSAVGFLDSSDRARKSGAASKGGAGFDYETDSGLVAWNDGQSHIEDITLNVLDDIEVELDEDFYLIIDAPTGGATLGDPDQVRIRIIDDDLQIFDAGFEADGNVVD